MQGAAAVGAIKRLPVGRWLSATLWLTAWLPAAQGQWRPFIATYVPTPETAPLADPLPLLRVLVPPERVPVEMERARKGILRQMPREEFEARVRRAALADRALQKPPRLLEARYRATLKDTALEGTGEWTVLNPANTGAVLPLQPFNLAVLEAKLDGADAVLGDLDGKGLGLWVEQPGKHSVSLKWTARGDPTPGGLRFEIKVPACVLTSLDLDLPADHTVTVPRDARLLPERLPGGGPKKGTVPLSSRGQSPFSGPTRQLWRLDCAGSPQIDLVIRQKLRPGHPSPLLLARLQTKQNISPSQVETDFDFLLEALHGAIAELHCECDPALHPLAVRVRNVDIETWEFRPGADRDSPATLRIRLPEPLKDSPLPLRIHCLSAVTPNQPWIVPGLRVTGAVSLGESLALHIAPEVRLEDWHPGTFDFVRAAPDADGGQTLTLRSGLRKSMAPAAGSRNPRLRPSARLKLQEPEVQARQATWWQIRPEGDVLNLRLDYRVMRGRLFRLSVLLPKDWTVQRVESNPADLTRSWTVMPPENGRSTLLVDLQRPLEPPDPFQLTVELRPRRDVPARRTDQEWGVAKSFPEIVPLTIQSVSGSLTIGVHPSYQASVQASLPEAAFPFPTLWGLQAPGHYYAYQGQPVTGVVTIQPRLPRVRAQCTTEVGLVAGRAQGIIRLSLQPEAGFPDVVDLFVSAPITRPWQWTSAGSEAVLEMQRLEVGEVLPGLLLLGAGSALSAANLLAVPSQRDRYWRLRLSQPLREPVTLETTIDLDVLGSAAEVPLIVILNARRTEGEVKLRLSSTAPLQIEGQGLAEAPGDSPDDVPIAIRTFRYTHAPVSLVLNGRLSGTGDSVRGWAEQTHLTTYVEPQGRLLHRYCFQIQHWNTASLPLRLPAGARLLTAKVDGRWISDLPTAAEGDVLAVELPTAGGSGPHRFEVVYETAGSSWLAWARVRAPQPVLPLPVAAFRRTWALPAGLTPLNEQHFHSSSLESWTRWEPIPGTAREDTLAVIRQDVFLGIAWALTAGLLLAGLGAGRHAGRWRFALLLGWLSLAALGIVWLPSGLRVLALGPMLSGAAVATLWFLRSAIRLRPAAVPRKAGVAGALALALAVGLPGEAAAPQTYTVLLLPGSGPGREKQTALVPPELLEGLEALARRGAQRVPGALLLDARYLGSVRGGAAEIEAIFRIHSFSDEATTLTVPLGGVELQEATLDGAAAYPVSLPPPQNSFALKVPGRGDHVLRLRFLVRLSSGEDQELRFTIPELAQSHLELTVPAGASHLHAVLGRGTQRITPVVGGTQLDADLGQVGTLQLRWRQESPQSHPPVVQVKEFYFWDLQTTTSRLLAVLHYTVSQGAATTLAVNLPDKMEVRRVETSPVPGGGPAPRLKDWLLSGTSSSRQLQLVFQTPVTHRVQVFVELVSSLPLEPLAALSLPQPQAASPTDGLLAYRVERRQASLVERRNVRPVELAEFMTMWPLAGSENPGPPEQVFRIQRPSGGAPFLKLDLRPTAAPVSASQDITWRVSERMATLHAQVRLSARDEDLALVECEVPALVTLTEVSGPDVRNWSRTGSRVQIWLQRSVAQTTVEMSGWLPRSAERAPALFRLPRLYLPAARPQTTFVRLLADRGWELQAQTLQDLWPLPQSRLSLQDHGYVTEQTAYDGVFNVQPATPDAGVRVQTRDSAGKVAVKNGKLPLRTGSLPVSGEAAQVLLDEQAAAVLDGRRWTHEARYWLYQESGMDVRVALPDGASLVRVTIDGADVFYSPSNGEPFWLPLSGGSGLRVVRLRWVFETETEPLDRLNLTKPRLNAVAHDSSVEPAQTVWTVYVPPGYQALPKARDGRSVSSAARDLNRAAAHFLLSKMLSERGPGFRETRSDWPPEPSDEDMAEQGIPTYWQASSAADVPHVEIVSAEAQQTRHALGLSALVLVLVLVAWNLSYYPRIVGRLRPLSWRIPSAPAPGGVSKKT